MSRSGFSPALQFSFPILILRMVLVSHSPKIAKHNGQGQISGNEGNVFTDVSYCRNDVSTQRWCFFGS